MLCTVYVYVRITEHFNSEVSNHQVAQKCIAYIWHSVIYYLFIIILIILYFRLLYAIAVQ